MEERLRIARGTLFTARQRFFANNPIPAAPRGKTLQSKIKEAETIREKHCMDFSRRRRSFEDIPARNAASGQRGRRRWREKFLPPLTRLRSTLEQKCSESNLKVLAGALRKALRGTASAKKSQWETGQ